MNHCKRRSHLPQVINQRELLPDTIDRLKLEIPSPALANACLQKAKLGLGWVADRKMEIPRWEPGKRVEKVIENPMDIRIMAGEIRCFR